MPEMKMRWFFVLIVLLILPCGGLAAEKNLSDVVAGIRQNYAHLEGLSVPYTRLVMTRSMAILGGEGMGDRATGTIYLAPPRFLRLEQVEPRPETIVTDGQTLWWVVPEENTAYRYPAAEFGRELKLLSDLFKGFREIEQEFDVLLKPDPEKQDLEMELTPNPPREDIHHLIVWVTPAYEIRELSIHNQVGGVTRFQLGQAAAYEAPGPDFFQFTPPEGMKVKDP